jgi:hypothetical protein
VSAAQLLDPETTVKRDKLIEGYWHNCWDDPPVESLRLRCFTWQEFKDRRDEMERVLTLQVAMLGSMGPQGASLGLGIREKANRSIMHSWANEKKLINRLSTRLKTAQRYADAISEVASSQVR